MGTKRAVSPADKAKFFAAIAQGKTISDASRVAGVHVNTGSKWLKKLKAAEANAELANAKVAKARRNEGGVQRDEYNAILDAIELPTAVAYEHLCDEAKRGLEDFDYFRRYYLGRMPSPWQVEAAYALEKLYRSEEKEFVVVNVPPGAGKSTLFHDLAVWMICRDRKIRIMIGSVSQAMAKLYSRRIRETLERPMPLQPDPSLVDKGLALNAEGCLSVDYGRFRPTDKGALWRADEFVVEQLDGNGLDNKEPTVRAYGIEAEFIGHRADLCLFDDVASPDNARESVARDKLLHDTEYEQKYTNYPSEILEFGLDKGAIHPTQKPVDLMEYLIRTYSNEGEVVLDNCMGSGTTGVAAVNTNRAFIGIERDEKYYSASCDRIRGTVPVRQVAQTPITAHLDAV